MLGMTPNVLLNCHLMAVRLSVVMPVYNERPTLREIMGRVLAVPINLELLCVDDGSRDGSRENLAELEPAPADPRALATEENGQRCCPASWYLLRKPREISSLFRTLTSK